MAIALLDKMVFKKYSNNFKEDRKGRAEGKKNRVGIDIRQMISQQT